MSRSLIVLQFDDPMSLKKRWTTLRIACVHPACILRTISVELKFPVLIELSENEFNSTGNFNSTEIVGDARRLIRDGDITSIPGQTHSGTTATCTQSQKTGIDGRSYQRQQEMKIRQP